MRSFIENGQALKGTETDDLHKHVQELNVSSVPVSGIITIVLAGARIIGRLVSIGAKRQFTVRVIERHGKAVFGLVEDIQEFLEVDPEKKAARQTARTASKTTRVAKRAAKKAAPKKK